MQRRCDEVLFGELDPPDRFIGWPVFLVSIGVSAGCRERIEKASFDSNKAASFSRLRSISFSIDS